MHIAIEASTWINTRGYGRFTRELTLALLRARTPHRFSLVVDFSATEAQPPLPAADVAVVPTTRAAVDAATAEGSRSPADMLRVAARLSRGFDAVLFPTNYSFVPVLPGRFVAVVIHDAIPEAMPALVLGSRRAQILWGAKNRLACWQADLIATVSDASAQAIRRHLPVGGRELLVLTEGASPVFTPQPAVDEEALRRAVLPEGGRFILFVGGISPHKRVADLVRAFGTIAAADGYEDLRLLLVGPEERDTFASDASGVAAAIASIGPLRDRVVRPGFVSDHTLAALYRGAEYVVLPSMAEGFGLPALEAMSSGTPLIVARNPAVQEVCGNAAEYVDDIGRLSSAMRRLLTDERRREQLRREGLERAGHFGWDEAARRLLTAFDRASA
jgi:glycosyltransferase involved in cell wall biosynthesis